MPSVELVESAKMSVLDEASARTPNGCEDAGDIEATKDNSPPAAVDQQQPGSNNTSNAKDSLSPVQQMCLIIEHKIRNLEKRKNKLDSYKLHEQEGKHLSNDQKMAILKYDECVTSLELARELCKQFSSIATVANRDAKKQAKKNAFLKVQQENAKIRESLMILDVVSRFTEDVVREDFLNGINGACQLTEEDIELLMMVYEQTKPQRPLKSTDKSFSCAVRSAAEILSGIIDGKPKAFGSANYGHVKSILNSIENCGYFEKNILIEETELREEMEQNFEKIDEGTSDKNETTIPPVEGVPARLVVPNNVESQPHIFAEAPAATAVPTPSFPLQANEMHTTVLSTSQAIIPTMHPQSTPANAFVVAKDSIESAVIVPAATVNLPIVSSVAPALQLAAPSVAATTVQAVENAYFKQHYMQNQLRPLHEVLGDANFFFLQESEIDKPDIPSHHGTYVSVEQPIVTLPLQAVVNDFQQFPGVTDSHLVMSVKAPIYNAPHSELTPNVAISNSGAVGSSGAFNNHAGLVNENQMMNVQPFRGPIINQNSLSGMQLLPTDVQNASNLHTVTMHMPASPFGQSQNVLPGTNEIATNAKEHQGCHIRGFASSSMIVAPTLPETHVQEIANHPEIAHASVQTNKPVGVIENHEIQKGNHPLHKTGDPIPTPVSMVANVYAHNPTPNMYPDDSMDKGIAPLLNVSSADLHQTQETGANTENVSLKVNDQNKLDLNTTDERFSLKCDGQSNRKKTSVAKGNKEEQKEWLKGAKKNDQWPSPASSVAQAQLKKDDTVGRNNFNRVRLSGNGQTIDAGKGSVPPTCSTHQNHLNGGSASVKFVSSPATISNNGPNNSHAMPSSNLHDVAAQPAGYRNNRSSNSQYTQNGLNSGRFNTENGTTSANHPTFFKNNERFYQNNYGSHRGGTVFKGRSEKLGGNTGSRINNNSAYSANNSAVENDAGNTPVGSLEYRNAQNVRSRNNARHNGPLGTRNHQRNNSANLAYSNHSTKDSSGRTQTGVNF
uniref:Caprin-1 dimerization domain-containing protein n=1 Tax=Anopheles atroparvus TaxID=41427 RepID=A0AAG5DVW4_ANOAO